MYKYGPRRKYARRESGCDRAVRSGSRVVKGRECPVIKWIRYIVPILGADPRFRTHHPSPASRHNNNIVKVLLNTILIEQLIEQEEIGILKIEYII